MGSTAVPVPVAAKQNLDEHKPYAVRNPFESSFRANRPRSWPPAPGICMRFSRYATKPFAKRAIDRKVGVKIEDAKDRYLLADHSSQAFQEFAFDIVHRFGNHRSVQNQVNRIERAIDTSSTLIPKIFKRHVCHRTAGCGATIARRYEVSIHKQRARFDRPSQRRTISRAIQQFGSVAKMELIDALVSRNECVS